MSTSPPSDVVRTSKLHDALRHALYLVPKGRSEIFSILRKNFPFKRARTSEQKHYVKQLLLILTYSPTLRRDVWGLIIHKCIEVDVEIKIYSGGGVKVVEEHGEGEEEDDTMFEIDGFTGEATEDARKCREGKEKRKRADSIGADEYADKLDEMLDLLIEDVNGLGDKGECYKCLEDVFEGCVVKTHKSKFTQFVWFVVCKMEADRKAAEAKGDGKDDDDDDDRLCRKFVGHLLQNTLSHTNPSIHRQSSACYLASFVSRALFVDVETAGEVVEGLIEWAEEYTKTGGRKGRSTPPGSPTSSMQRQGGMTRPSSPRVSDHMVFYSIAQSIFYILCFRPSVFGVLGRDGGEGVRRIVGLCGHRFKPLKHCLSSVRDEFLKLICERGIISTEVAEEIREGLGGREGARQPCIMYTHIIYRYIHTWYLLII